MPASPPSPAPAPPAPASPDAPGAASDAAEGLRAAKKRRARDAMHRAALELVADHGLSGVTVEMIAERAEVSPRTFFNYWETKEAAMLGLDPERAVRALQLLAERPAGEPPHLSLRAVLIELTAHLPPDPELRLLKKRALEREPLLTQLSMGNLSEIQTLLTDALAERLAGEAVTVTDASQARVRAHLCVQLAFAASRTAFALSMAHGTETAAEMEHVHALIDQGRASA